MVCLALLFLPIIASSVPIDTGLTMIEPTPNLDPIPNPFPVPGTDVTLEFLPSAASSLQPPRTDVIKLFTIAKSDLKGYMRVQGDGPIMGDEYLLDYGKAELTLTSNRASMDPFTYSDALGVLLGVSLVLARKGYVNTSVRVRRTGFPQLIGLAAVYRSGITREISI